MNKTLRAFIRKELLQALRDPRMRVVIFLIPLVQLTVFGVAISTEVKNVKLAAQYRPSDTLMQTTMDRALGSGWFITTRVRGDDPFEWVRSGDADAVLVSPPEGMTGAVERRGSVQLLINASNVVQAQAVENYLKSILSMTVRDRVLRAGPGTPPGLVIDTRVLYNPTLRSPVFLVPGVMSMLLCIITILLTSMAIAREKEMGTFEMIVSAPVRPAEILLGKTLPFVLLGMIDVPLIMAVAVLGFKVPMRGGLAEFALAAFVFVCVTVSLGTLISSIAKSQQQAMMGSFIFLYLAILLSGIMFSVESMPWYVKVLSYLDPLKYFVTLLRNVMLKGGNPEVYWTNLGVLAGMGVLSAWVSVKRFRANLS